MNRQQQKLEAIDNAVGELDNIGDALEAIQDGLQFTGNIPDMLSRLSYNLVVAGLCDKSSLMNTIKQIDKHSKRNCLVTYIKVGGVIAQTRGEAVIFKTPGLKGGWYKHPKYGPRKRDDNVRSIPLNAIVDQYDQTTGEVGVETKWLSQPDQRDLRDYMDEVK